jgi:hypothetical protein
MFRIAVAVIRLWIAGAGSATETVTGADARPTDDLRYSRADAGSR